MKTNHNILIVEPSAIIREGISGLIKSINLGLNIVSVNSLNNSLKIQPVKPFKFILINHVIFNNSPNDLRKFSSHFNGIRLIGIISTYYNRDLCSNLADHIYLNDDKNTVKNIIDKYLTSKNKTKLTAPNNILSEREIEVFKLLVSGKSNKEIAEKLFISIHTVVTHRKNLSKKLGIKSTAAMAIYAVANNIIDLSHALKSIK